MLSQGIRITCLLSSISKDLRGKNTHTELGACDDGGGDGTISTAKAQLKTEAETQADSVFWNG